MASWFLLLGVSLVGSAPFFFKHTRWPLLALAVYAGLLVFATSCLRRAGGPIGRALESGWFPILGVVAVGALNLVVYPAMREVASPSTAPDALIEPARLLLLGAYPYAAELPGRVPVSPGPGWLLLNLPLVAWGLVPLLMPLYLGACGWALWSVRRQARSASVFLCLLLTCLNFLQKSVEGHDLFAVTCAMTTVTIAVWSSQSSPRRLLILGALAGVIATARVPFLLHPLGVAALLLSDRRACFTFGVPAFVVAIGLHVGFWLWGESVHAAYQPMHVFGRAQAALGGAGLVAAAMLWGAVEWGLGRRVPRHLADWLFHHWHLLFVPFALVGVAELLRADPIDLAHWEGKNYVTFTLPLLAASLALRWAGTEDGGAPGGEQGGAAPLSSGG